MPGRPTHMKRNQTPDRERQAAHGNRQKHGEDEGFHVLFAYSTK